MTDWLTQRPYAHRGLHDVATGVVENSPAAFTAAINGGYGIELDVQLSGDGEVMVFHDRGLDRLTNEGKIRLADKTAVQLQKIRLKHSEDTIPTLAAILELVAGRVPVLVELKTLPQERAGRLEQRTAQLLERYTGPIAVMSFAPSSVGWFAQNAPHITRGQVAMDFIKFPAELPLPLRESLTRLDHVATTQPQFIAYHIDSVPVEISQQARALDVPWLSWTVRTAEQIEHAQKHVDQIIFEGFVPASDDH